VIGDGDTTPSAPTRRVPLARWKVRVASWRARRTPGEDAERRLIEAFDRLVEREAR